MEDKFKVGDWVELASIGRSENEGDNWIAKEENVNIGDRFKVSRLGCSEGWIVLEGLFYEHPGEKFKLINNNLKSTIGKALKNHVTTKAYRNEVMAHLENATFYQDNKLTFLKTDKGTGYALRNPEDANDTEKGIYLAVTRIFGETKPKWQVEVDECVKSKISFSIKSSVDIQKYFFSINVGLGRSKRKEIDKNIEWLDYHNEYLCLGWGIKPYFGKLIKAK